MLKKISNIDILLTLFSFMCSEKILIVLSQIIARANFYTRLLSAKCGTDIL